jgi:glycosidase
VINGPLARASPWSSPDSHLSVSGFGEGVKETNWSVTRPVIGSDGVERRRAYLHHFKDGQPSINWLDPSFAGMRLVIGDALHSLADFGSGGLRLDANGFLGVEKSTEGMPA